MGMYTELHFIVRLKDNLPNKFYEWLRDWLRKDLPDMEHKIWGRPYDDHEFFQTERWNILPHMGSEYFQFESHSYLIENGFWEKKTLSIHSNLKNYDSEIEEFLNWIKPFCHYPNRESVVGYYRHEEWDEPTLIRLSEIKEEKEQ